MAKKKNKRIDWNLVLEQKFKELYYEGHSYKEIGEVFGTTDKNAFARAKTLINRGFMTHRSKLPVKSAKEIEDIKENGQPTPEVEKVDGNPFEIKDDMSLDVRGDKIMLVTMLALRIAEIEPGDKKNSVVIPITICEDKKSANNLIYQLRRFLDSSNLYTYMTVSLKTIKDIQGGYVETRVWRVS